MPYIRTPKGRFHYSPKSIYLGIKRIDRDVAFDNLKTVAVVMQKAGLTLRPAYGTLLGIIRENDFIEWDEDIDINILSEEKDRFLDILWDLKVEGFELVRVDLCGYLYSVMRNNEYIDFYIQESISPEVRTYYGDCFEIEKYLTDLKDWDFKGINVSIPKDCEEYLEFMYGDWRTPVKYADFELSEKAIFKSKIKIWLKNLLPNGLRFRLQKRHHLPDYKAFLEKCNKKGVKLQYKINYL